MALRLALGCGWSGDIESVLFGGPLPAGDAGHFSGLLEPGSRAKGEQFLTALRVGGAAAGWELLLRASGDTRVPQALRFAGVAVREQLYITGEDVPDVLDEITLLNNQLVNAQRELAREKAALARANQDLFDFAAVVSHDLRAPLRNIRQLIELFANRPGERTEPWLEHVVQNASRMEKLIDDTLALVRPGRVNLPAGSAVPLNEVVDRASLVSPFVSRGDLPVVRGLPSQIEILFQNLFENAARHSRTGHPLRVHVSSEPAGAGRCRIVVEDNGQGIPASLGDRIFDRFSSGDGGTGIGLATCRQVVRQWGGEISVESEAGQGATFRFTLPAA